MYTAGKLLLFISQCSLYNGFIDWRRIDVVLMRVVPTNIEVLEGTQAAIHCGSSTEASWSYGGQKPIHWLHYPLNSRHIIRNNTLILINLRKEESGHYYCHGTGININTRNTSSNHSFSRSMIVKVFKKIAIGRMLPSRVEVSAGDSVSLTCGSYKWVRWIGLYLDEFTQTNTIIIQNLTRKDSGRYLCRGVDDRNEVFFGHSLIIVDGFINFISNRLWIH